MQYMPSSSSLASPMERPVAPIESVIVTPAALLAAFASVPDPRRAQGRRFSLAAILTLTVAAILSNHLSVLAIAEWGADQSHELLRALGFACKTTPRQSTIQRLFKKLSPDHLATALTNCFDKARTEPARRPRGSQGVAIDGKAQRGRLSFDHSGCPVHALSALLHDYGVVLASETIEPHGPTDKAEAELTVAPALIEHVDWQGRVLTGDALFCQRNLCQQVLDAGGDYRLTVSPSKRTRPGSMTTSAYFSPLLSRRCLSMIGVRHKLSITATDAITTSVGSSPPPISLATATGRVWLRYSVWRGRGRSEGRPKEKCGTESPVYRLMWPMLTDC